VCGFTDEHGGWITRGRGGGKTNVGI
jgi:hypothetical protein